MYQDNSYLDQKYKQTVDNLAFTDQNYYNVYRLGKWGTLGQVIFSNYTVLPKYDINITKIRQLGIPHYIGNDWGFNDPCVALYIKIHDNDIYILDELYLTHKTNPQ